jgi:hypothetical protein
LFEVEEHRSIKSNSKKSDSYKKGSFLDKPQAQVGKFKSQEKEEIEKFSKGLKSYDERPKNDRRRNYYKN